MALTSADPSKLVLAPRTDQPGSASITLTVPAGQFTATYSIQALGDTGEVTYEAVAPGFRKQTAQIGLARSGVIIAYDPYGPPDEASVLRKGHISDDRLFFVSLEQAKQQPIKIAAWTASLDPETGRAADITVSPLRPGLEVTVTLRSSNPAVGTVETPLTIYPGTNRALGHFIPLAEGTTVISVDTPAGFSTPMNAIKVPANVTK